MDLADLAKRKTRSLTVRGERTLALWNLQLTATARLRAVGGLTMDRIRRQSLNFVQAMRMPEHGLGRYRYAPSQGDPVLYASIYAVLIRHLYGDLLSLSDGERREWAAYIASYQTDDGLFRDPLIAGALAENLDWWGTRHLTLHALMAIAALDATAPKPINFLESYYDPARLVVWLEELDWGAYPGSADTCNVVQNVGTLLQYARDFQMVPEADASARTLFAWLDMHMDPVRGTWTQGGGTHFSDTVLVVNSYHLWCLYFYERRRLPFKGMVDLLLSTQRWPGRFGPELNSSACDDIDAIDPIARICCLADYRRDEITASLNLALPWVLLNRHQDGGYVFKRGVPFTYGHSRMSSHRNESAMFPTWFRTLSLAYIAQALPDSFVAQQDWHFLPCPGHQFWLVDGTRT